MNDDFYNKDTKDAEYFDFVEKFKPKKTTDDCYTPDNIYEAVRDWAVAKYSLQGRPVVRPFWPGGNYENMAQYSPGCVVIDNPPFSILGNIEKFYLREKIDFFLFAPALAMFKPLDGINYICASCGMTYLNGAKVLTSFVTNLGEYLVESAPDLCAKIKAINAQNEKIGKKEVRKLEIPLDFVTAARVGYYSIHGIDYKLRREDAAFVRKSDRGGGLFGSAFLITERAAIERAAIERAARMKFDLSPREREIQRMLAERAKGGAR